MAEKVINTMGCNNCGGRCVIHAHVEDGKIIKITTEGPGDVADGEVPFTACIRGLNYHKTFLGDDRLLYPMKRVGKRGEGKFERISWEEAVDIISSEWKRIKETYGPASRYIAYGWGQDGILRGNHFAERLLNLDGGFLDGYNSYSCACTEAATRMMYGTNLSGNSYECILDTKFLILWGHNPSETRFDSYTMYYLRKVKELGVPIYIIDPRRSDTVDVLGATWIPIRPATDPAMMDAMAFTIYSKGLLDQAFLDKYCSGFDKEHMPEGIDGSESYLSYLLGEMDGVVKDCKWAEKICGVPAKTIENLAAAYASAKPAAIIEGYGPQRNAYGEQITRGAILLSCMTGNVGVSGGSAVGHGTPVLHHEPKFPKGENAYKGKIPVYRYTDAVAMRVVDESDVKKEDSAKAYDICEAKPIDTVKEKYKVLDSESFKSGDAMTSLQGVKGVDKLDVGIKMIINLGGNALINQHGDINKTAEILRDTSKCEFILCSDLFMTASAKFADILLPGTSFLEGNNLLKAWKFQNFLGFANKVVEPVGESRFEYDWLLEVADRLGLKEKFSEGRTTDDWAEYCYCQLKKEEPELPEFEEFKQAGIYKYKEDRKVIAFSDFIEDPINHPLATPSGKIEIFSTEIWNGEYEEFMPAIPRYVKCKEGYDDELAEKYPLQLIGWHTKRRCHSIHDNNKELHKIDPQRVWMNPVDAKNRGLEDGDEVKVYNDRGALVLPVFITERIMKGVTAISQGAWYAPDENGIDRGGCINVLTSLNTTPYARGNAQHTNLVEIEKF